MRFGNFTVNVPEGSERDSGHVHVRHGTQYSLRLISHDHRRCDARVELDGKHVGTFRLDPHVAVTLQRGAGDSGRFTFYARGTAEEARAGGDSVAADAAGLIRVKFSPELRPYRNGSYPGVVRGAGGVELRCASFSAAGGQSASFNSGTLERKTAGITGLSGHSDQTFTEVSPLTYDEAASVTITLRLVADEGAPGPRPLAALGAGNAVPPPV